MTARNGANGSYASNRRNDNLAAALMRRVRTAQFTPAGWRQPPEVAGVDADARVPNALQPESGEMTGRGEVEQGRPGFWTPPTPEPTGIANGVGVSAADVRLIGTPPRAVKIAAPPIGADLSGISAMLPAALARLPQFAAGGALAPGSTGVVGEEGEEAVSTLPGGGARVTPLTGTSHIHSPARDLSGLAAMKLGDSILSPHHELTSGSSGASARPAPQIGAEERFLQAADAVAAEKLPARVQKAFRQPLWRMLAGIGMEALESGLMRNPAAEPALYGQTAPDLHQTAMADYQTQYQADLSALGPLLDAAKLEQARNEAATKARQLGLEQGDRRQQAAGAYRSKQEADRQQSGRQRAIQQQALEAHRQ
ncbi:MAG: hypothetical protein ACRD1M_03310 [Terriglobales bacterium]